MSFRLKHNLIYFTCERKTQKISLFYSGKHLNKLNYMFLNEIINQIH